MGSSDQGRGRSTTVRRAVSELYVPGDDAAEDAHLAVVHSPNRDLDQSFVAVSGSPFAIGRELGAEAGFSVTDADESASRRHAVIERIERGYRLFDSGSTNGTFVNGHPLRAHQSTFLCEGDLIRAGDTLFVFRYGPIPPADDDPDLPGVSPAIRAARQWLAKVVTLDHPVLLLGETGTGKEYAARACHQLSGCARGPFIAVNCGEMERSLVRSELFGAVKGAFTGATAARGGLVGEADGGTLFLDEIGELDPEVQKSLLRFLETATYRPVGGLRALPSSARVVAATNVDLDAAVSSGAFREDLLGRLRAVEPVVLPPLRERRDDLVAWARRFCAAAFGGDRARQGPPERWEAGFVEALLLHPWPRNLRELREAMLTAALRAEGAPALKSEHLPDKVAAARREARQQTLGDAAAEPEPPPTIPPERRHEWLELHRALTQHRGNVNEAANELGTYRRRIYRWIDQFGMDLEQYRRGDRG